ncbi:NUDIX hydrolase [Thermococcus argininiproducens]|uniref:NUDIX hydrolase n=1 Tax=Thermococcus argininiproducens TaxID=2866384 RepID=A0A9E7SCP5_9EURY|nr:NUDIX hydrolase [Thermococcus argininiproducens]USG99651.1 NUDIX hydrolase [Thermococcus argininiproducens]
MVILRIRQMVTFEKGDMRFNYRVVGIIFNKNYVLLHRAEKDDFWALPGGRVELLEPSKDALKREMQEELNVEVRVDRLIWVVETFFKDGETLFHEMGLYYLVELPKDCSLCRERQFLGKEHLEEEKEIRLIFKWFSLDELEALPLYPGFLRKALKELPETTHHIEVWENLKKRSKSV